MRKFAGLTAILCILHLPNVLSFSAGSTGMLRKSHGSILKSVSLRHGILPSAAADPTFEADSNPPKRSFFGALNPKGMDKGKLAAMGTAALLSYGAVSNLSTSILVSIAWYTFSAKSGLSPLAPGQWKGFLAVYGGLWVMNNFLRPLRIGAAAAVAPVLDRFVGKLQSKFGISKAKGFALAVFVINVFGTITIMSGGIAAASLFSGVSVFPAATA